VVGSRVDLSPLAAEGTLVVGVSTEVGAATVYDAYDNIRMCTAFPDDAASLVCVLEGRAGEGEGTRLQSRDTWLRNCTKSPGAPPKGR